MCAVSSTAPNAYDGFRESKLFKVNFTSLYKCGTIEFKHLGATTNATKIIEWIYLVIRFCAITLDPKVPTAEELVMAGEVEEFLNRSSVASSGRSFRTKKSF
jgi:hypothetical protein